MARLLQLSGASDGTEISKPRGAGPFQDTSFRFVFVDSQECWNGPPEVARSSGRQVVRSQTQMPNSIPFKPKEMTIAVWNAKNPG